MKTHREIWQVIKKDKVVRIEMRVSPVDSLRTKAVRSMRRALSKYKNEDDNYKLRHPFATLTSEIVSYEQSTNLLMLEFRLDEPIKNVEEL